MRPDLQIDGRFGVDHEAGVWFREPAREMTIFAEQYDFSISLLMLDDAPAFSSVERQLEPDTYMKMVSDERRGREW